MNHDIVIAGAGPAGSALAILLARRGLKVLLLEKSRFPRQKLCGEFLSPECWWSFERLGLSELIARTGGTEIRGACIVSPAGELVLADFPPLSAGERGGLGLSRFRLDHMLLEAAKAAGAEVIEGSKVTRVVRQAGAIRGVEGVVRGSGTPQVFLAKIIVAADGRHSVIARELQALPPRRPAKRVLVAFGAHFTQVQGSDDRVELFLYPGGYGGLVRIEEGMTNLCFITEASVVRRCRGDVNRLLEQTMLQNRVSAGAHRA